MIRKYYHNSSNELASWFAPFIVADLAGGLMEIVWVSLYSFLIPVSATHVAREISATLIPASVDLSYAPMAWTRWQNIKLTASYVAELDRAGFSNSTAIADQRESDTFALQLQFAF